MALQIINETPITMYELKDELAKIKKRDKELNFRANKTEEYLQKFATLKNAEELTKKLTDLNIPRLKDQHIKKIVDLSPLTAKELKVILQGYILTVNNENIKKIIDTIDKVVGNK